MCTTQNFTSAMVSVLSGSFSDCLSCGVSSTVVVAVGVDQAGESATGAVIDPLVGTGIDRPRRESVVGCRGHGIPEREDHLADRHREGLLPQPGHWAVAP